MRAVVQRVKNAFVDVADATPPRRAGEIRAGLLVLLGVEHEDSVAAAEWLSAKVANLRIFEDAEGKMNLSVKDCGGDILLVSQFTLYGNVRKGSRPSFNRSAPPNIAVPLYEKFGELLELETGKKIQRGVFGAMMDVGLVNDGPVTVIIDSANKDI